MARTPALPGQTAKAQAKASKTVPTLKRPQAMTLKTTVREPKRSAPAQDHVSGSRLSRLRRNLNERAGLPGVHYYWIIGATVALTSIGLITVLSASAAESISAGQDPYFLFIKESLFAVFGLVLMMALSFVPPSGLKKLAWPVLGLALILLVLVFSPLGKEVGGNRNWINLGESFSFQPSEAAKLAMALWMGLVLSRKGRLVANWRHTLLPVVPVGVVLIGLILLGHDLGTAVIAMAVLGAGLFFGGGSKRVLLTAIGGGVGAAVLLAAFSGNRTARLSAWLGNCNDGQDLCDQAQNGLYALASGGWFGVGLGQSRQKWSWIPEAHNDFIFAIIGEELGLLGTLVIIGLYSVLAFAIFRVVMRRNDTFARVVCGSILTWIIGQAFVNIAMVVGILPVIGVPLPLISYGGSALVVTLAALGVVLSFARTSPQNDPDVESTSINP
ncbi:putative lipid II flippase FtsW [Arthrobacter cryoconiti]|uniref:Probable peptidoglycan glycosyltransferase FtsW n=1 Tax=Arthrobacter cryoconiti TaxID=748907 RepID=A0ABV8R3V1_9MICC|nr:putative lipid II flippase FtsW [Arthrobacter cryoconiti]MCC9069105.1 putative lipid II flippase FtsW [Arthrobacter cryoconiti]